MQSSQFTEEKKNNQLPELLDKNDTKNEGQRGRWQSLCVSLVDAVCVSNQMAKHRSAVSITNRVLNADCTYGGVGSSSLHTTMKSAGAITIDSSPAHQRCTEAKEGKFQGGLLEQNNAVE